MKTFVILSDTHGNQDGIQKLSQIFAESDYIIHLGDHCADMRNVQREYPEKCYICAGNCDFGGGLDEYVLEAEGHRIFFCHGHRYGVKQGIDELIARAKELDCDIALYGHTHIAFCEQLDGIWVINPGNVTRYSFEKSYCYLCLHGEKVVPTIVPIR